MPYLFDIAVRLAVPLLILRSPWWGFLLALAIDGIDLNVIESIGYAHNPNFTTDYGRYQTQDKWLDAYMFAIAAYMSRLWPEKLAYNTSLILFWYRVVGVLLFEITGARWLLFAFPNVFEYFYLFCAFMFRYKPAFQIQTGKRLAIILLFLTVLKLPQEYVIHIVQTSYWGFFKQTIMRWLR
jgi:hypothetical protein